MPSLSRKGSRTYERVIEAVKRYVEQHVIPSLKPLLVILYGSFARGDFTDGSDIDLLIIAENIPGNYWDRWSLAYEIVENFPTDPHIYTPDEFRVMLTDGRMTALDALTEGLIIYAEPNYIREVNERLLEVLKRKVKYRGAWIPIQYLPKLAEPK
ncbi:MAG: nucleotidyltransferase domain-containing protein [Candidatus Bathyarchaeia archaeon]